MIVAHLSYYDEMLDFLRSTVAHEDDFRTVTLALAASSSLRALRDHLVELDEQANDLQVLQSDRADASSPKIVHFPDSVTSTATASPDVPTL